MKRHPFDPISFSTGVVFLLIAGTIAFSRDIDFRFEAWVFPASILILGLGLLVGTVRTGARSSDVQGRDPSDDAMET